MPPLKDPFTGRAYQYLSSGDIDRIYSLGPDRIDQQGMQPFDLKIGQGDIYLIGP